MNALTTIDPANIGFPTTLPVELALRVNSPREICEAYGISREEWDALRVNETFRKAVQDAVELVAKEGMSFRLKAQAQSEDYLGNAYKLVNASHEEVPPAVKADLIKFTIRVAGLDASIAQKAGVAMAQQNQTVINIHLE